MLTIKTTCDNIIVSITYGGMKIMIKTTFKNFELRAIHAGEKNPVWKDGQDRTHCHHVIRVKNMETKKFFSFDYWTSLSNP